MPLTFAYLGSDGVPKVLKQRWLLSTSCSITPPTPSEVASIGYGGPLSANYKAVVQDYLNTHLKDPFSAVLLQLPVRRKIGHGPRYGLHAGGLRTLYRVSPGASAAGLSPKRVVSAPTDPKECIPFAMA